MKWGKSSYHNYKNLLKFHQYKSTILIDYIDINKIVVCNKVNKYFIGYRDARKIELCGYFFQN